MPDEPMNILSGDLAIVKDVLIHLNNASALSVMVALSKKFRFILVVNNAADEQPRYNVEIESGKFRPVDVSLPPFSIQCATVLRYSSTWCYDPAYPLFIAKALQKRVWPGRKHVQLIIPSKC